MRHTSSHTKNRRSHHALSTTTIVTDKESGKLRLPHRLDESTGMYRGIQIVSKKDIQKAEQKVEKKNARKREHVHPEGGNETAHTSDKHLAEEKSEALSQGILPKSTKDRPRSRAGTA